MAEPSTVAVPVTLPGRSEGSYEVRVGAGVWGELPELLRERVGAHRYAMISDDRVAELHAAALADRLRDAGLRVELLAVPAGEGSKSRERWGELSDSMFAAGFGRDAAVLAVGGGVVGDLAGFVAATYMRGVPVVQLPTTLLAMIDSSVGGKTGIDTPAGKNLLGAFHPPALVIADTATLATLPRAELAAGLAEAVKHGAIADAGYLERIRERAPALLAAEPAELGPLVLRSVAIKAAVVGRDERESGPRRALNFGHTIGHAVEALSEYRLLHGEAVAIGMIAEARIGESLGITEAGTAERLRAVLEAAELPTEMPPGYPLRAVLERTRTDKKARAGRVEYSLLERIGAASRGEEGSWGWAVEDGAVLDALRA